MPKSANNVRAIVDSGRAQAIFVRFEGGLQEQDEIVAALASKGVAPKELDAQELAAVQQSASTPFDEAAKWQDRIGLALYVPSSVRSARLYEGKRALPSSALGQTGGDLLYTVLIDRKDGVVYVYATRRDHQN